MTRRLLGVAYRTYPEWWRDRYGQESRQVAEQLADEGRSPIRIALDVAGEGAKNRLHAAPPALRPPAGPVMLRASGRSQSAAFVGVLLAIAVLEGGAAAYDDLPPGLHPRFSFEPGTGLVLAAQVSLAVGAGLLFLAVIGSVALSLRRMVRGRDGRGFGLLLASVVPLVAVPAIAYGAVQLLDTWASHGLVHARAADVPRLFAMILLGQDPRAIWGFTNVWGIPEWAVVCAASWLALAVVVGSALVARRSLRRHTGLPAPYLRIEAVLSFGAGLALIVAWACMLAWSVSVPAAPLSWDFCPPCEVAGADGPASFTALWWGVVVVMGLAGTRSLVAGTRALRAQRRFARA